MSPHPPKRKRKAGSQAKSRTTYAPKSSPTPSRKPTRSTRPSAAPRSSPKPKAVHAINRFLAGPVGTIKDKRFR